MAVSMEYLRLIAFILVNATIVQALDVLLKKFSPTLYSSIGVYLSRLITANCVIFLTVNTMVAKEYVSLEPAWQGLMMAALYAFAVGVGYLLAVILMAGAREKESSGRVPVYFRGFPITLIIAGLMALVFSGFAGF
ncbi:MAG: electron transport complex subunit RsxA, partial [Firmicutes bacterium]|nr:electron transport complex subunit RsxA [Bacillota bacterium]